MIYNQGLIYLEFEHLHFYCICNDSIFSIISSTQLCFFPPKFSPHDMEYLFKINPILALDFPHVTMSAFYECLLNRIMQHLWRSMVDFPLSFSENTDKPLIECVFFGGIVPFEAFHLQFVKNNHFYSSLYSDKIPTPKSRAFLYLSFSVPSNLSIISFI